MLEAKTDPGDQASQRWPEELQPTAFSQAMSNDEKRQPNQCKGDRGQSQRALGKDIQNGAHGFLCAEPIEVDNTEKDDQTHNGKKNKCRCDGTCRKRFLAPGPRTVAVSDQDSHAIEGQDRATCTYLRMSENSDEQYNQPAEACQDDQPGGAMARSTRDIKNRTDNAQEKNHRRFHSVDLALVTVASRQKTLKSGLIDRRYLYRQITTSLIKIET